VQARSTDPQSERKGNTQHQSYNSAFSLSSSSLKPIRILAASRPPRQTNEQRKGRSITIINSTLVSSQQLSRSIAFSKHNGQSHHIHAQWVPKNTAKRGMEAKGAKDRRMNDHTQYVRRNSSILVIPAVFSHKHCSTSLTRTRSEDTAVASKGQ